jgi:hypothetical protein
VIRNSFELVDTGVFKRESGACHQVLHGLRDQDLRRTSQSRDASPDRNGDACDLAVDQLALARVHSRTNLDPEIPDASAGILGASDRSGGTIEVGVEAVAGGVDLHAAPAFEGLPNKDVMALDNLLPSVISERRLLLG